MKKIIVFFSLLTACTMQAQSLKSLEAMINFGISSYTNFDKIDHLLRQQSYPNLSSEIETFSSGQGGIFLTYKINRWGLLGGYSFMNVKTQKDANLHYYRGNIDHSFVGVSYDIIRSGLFILSPYVRYGNSTAEIYLDYELKEGVKPTSLHILGKENSFSIGTKFYFRIAKWNEERWQLFVNADAYYMQSYPQTWRFDNQLINSKDFSLSHIGILLGISLQYSLK